MVKSKIGRISGKFLRKTDDIFDFPADNNQAIEDVVMFNEANMNINPV